MGGAGLAAPPMGKTLMTVLIFFLAIAGIIQQRFDSCTRVTYHASMIKDVNRNDFLKILAGLSTGIGVGKIIGDGLSKLLYPPYNQM